METGREEGPLRKANRAGAGEARWVVHSHSMEYNVVFRMGVWVVSERDRHRS